MNFFKDVISHLVKNAFEGHAEFSVADNTAVGDNPVRTISLDAVALDGDSLVSLSWDGGEKVFEKKLSEQEASHQFDLLAIDLAEVAALTKQGQYDSAKDLMKKLSQKYAENTGEIVPTNMPKLNTTQADMKNWDYFCPKCKDQLESNMEVRIHDKQCDGKVELRTEAAQEKGIWKQAKITMQNLFFSNAQELVNFQQEMKKLQPNKGDQDNVPLWEKNQGQAPESGDTLAPPSMSYEQMEEDKAKETKNLDTRIKDQVKTELESALEEKKATMFSEKDEKLIEGMRAVGRTWDEIKKYMVKDLSYDKESVDMYIDEKRSKEDGTPVVREEKPEPLRPPEDLVSPETHDKLLKDIEEKKNNKPIEEVKEDEVKVEKPIQEESAKACPTCGQTHKSDVLKEMHPDAVDLPLGKMRPEDFMGIPEVEASQDEIARADNSQIKKVALNPLQEPPVVEEPTTPSQDEVPMEKSMDHNAPQKGDRVYVASDLNDEKAGFEATFVSIYDSKGTSYSIVETDDGDLLDVESHRVVKTSTPSPTQDTEPVMEPTIEAPIEEPIQITPSTEALTQATSSLDDAELISIKADLAKLEIAVAEANKISFLFVRQGLEKHANESAYEGNGWCRVWVQEDEIAVNEKYAQILTLPDETQRINALKEVARDIAHEQLRLADSAAGKVGVQAWFDTLDPSRHDNIDWVALATPQPAEAAQAPKVEKQAELPAEHICEQCKQPMGYQGFLGPVCDKCVKKNHKKVTGTEVEKKADEPAPQPTAFDEKKIAPKYVDRSEAVPATTEMSDVISKFTSIEQKLSVLDRAKNEIKAKMNEELKKIDEQGGRSQLQAEYQDAIEKLAMLISATQSKLISWNDQLYNLQQEEVHMVPKLTPTELLGKIYKKFDGAEKFVDDVLNGMKSLAQKVTLQKLVRFPEKKSSQEKEANALDDLNRMNQEMLDALKLLSSPL